MVQGTLRSRYLFAIAGALLLALAAAAQASADPFVPSALRQAAAANPTKTFKVIVQGAPHVSSHGVAGYVQTQERSHPGREHGVRRSFHSLSGVSAELTGRQITALSSLRWILAITPDVPLSANLLADPPTNVVPPSVAGTPQQDDTLTALNGQWTGGTLPYAAFAYQWSRCDAGGLNCVDIAGATGSDYVPTADDVGSTLAVSVTATDASGATGTAVSAASAQIAAPPPPQLLPPANLSAPVVSGLPRAGETLSAVEGMWQGTVPMTYAFQWQRCSADCADIAGATGATYVPTGDDVGSALRVVVTAEDATGSTAAASSLTPNVTAAPLTAVTPPAISGDASAGSTLSADAGVWSGGVAPLQFTYRWQRCASLCSDVGTGSSYVVGAGDAGTTLSVTVTATDANGETSSASSSRAVPAAAPLTAVTPPAISGDPSAGATLSADTGGWSGGVAPLQFTYRWQRCAAICSDVGSDPSYVVQAGDAGTTLSVTVTATDANGQTASATSSLAVPAAALLTAVTPPAISGDPSVGATLSADTGLWSGGVAPLQFTYSWQRCAAVCSDVGTDSSYVVQAGDAGTTLSVTVTATDANGATAGATSSVAVAAAAAPVDTSPPTIDGNYQASPGNWTGKSITFTYQWSRCDETGANCAAIDGATTAAYQPVADDIGNTLRVTVTATNDGGSATAVSDATPRVPPATPSGYWNWQMWPYAVNADSLWGQASPPAIAVVDSGVDPTLPGLGGVVSQEVTVTTLPQRAVADGYGHGSFVAQVAAGTAPGDAGAAPGAKIVSLDVMDDNGMALTSDVIAAADWIYTNGASAGIRVANFSLLGASPSSFQYDPLDRALEKLWLSGVVVVTAAGNFGTDGSLTDEPYAPANDPFAITVGASDIAGTLDPGDDLAAPWSAYGHTLDGFAKPELGAPGRYVVESVPTDSTLYTTRPDRIVAPGELQLSGTSFAAPIVSGIAADLLAVHPDWTPDQVKGALMLTAVQPGTAAPNSLGVGEVDADAASLVVDPPNPNAELDPFLVPDPSGGPTPVFDTASWGTTVQADASWGTASWGTASWGTASWGTASWGTTYWSSASWGTASWGTASWGTTAEAADNAKADILPSRAYWMRWSARRRTP